MTEFERITRFRPAFDCIRVQPCVHGKDTCQPNTGGSHGIHNVELTFTLRGSECEVSLAIGTGWYLPVTPELPKGLRDSPNGYFVEFHTARPQYDDHERREPQPGDSCFGWGGCYLNTGFSMSDDPTALLVEKGSDAVWEWLEGQYNRIQIEVDAVARVQANSGKGKQ